MVFVDGVEVGDIEDVALRDRRALSADGIFIVVATVSGQDGRPLAPPEVICARRPVPGRGRRRGRGDPRDRRDVARARGGGRGARDHRCSRSTCARTWRRSSTSACAGARWCCRSWSRSRRFSYSQPTSVGGRSPHALRSSGRTARRPQAAGEARPSCAPSHAAAARVSRARSSRCPSSATALLRDLRRLQQPRRGEDDRRVRFGLPLAHHAGVDAVRADRVRRGSGSRRASRSPCSDIAERRAPRAWWRRRRPAPGPARTTTSTPC